MENRNTGEAAAPRAGSSCKKKRFRTSALLRITGLVFAALLIALATVFVLRLYMSVPNEDDIRRHTETGVYAQGISVHGEDVSGLTLAKARELIMSKVESDAKRINISVVHDTTLWLLSGADLNVSSDIDIVLTNAMKLGFDGSYVENHKLKKQLATDGLALDVAFIADDSALSDKLSAIALAIDTDPVDPAAEPVTWDAKPSFEYHEGSDGYVLDEAALKSEITSALSSGNLTIVLTPDLQLAKPEHDMEWLKSNTQLRATFQTSFGGSRSARNANRVGNIQKSTTILNGAKIQPGEEFDFNEYIGPRTEKGGWPLAPGIVSGNTYEMQPGGGICQVSTTLYNALLIAGASLNTKLDRDPVTNAPINIGDSPIVVSERWHHSWPSSYADRGLDATVSTGGKNLRFVNNTSAPMYIFAYCDQEEYLSTIYIYGEPLPDGVTYKVYGETVETTQPPATLTVTNPEWPTGYQAEVITSRPGYKAVVYRDTLINGKISGEPEKLYSESYSPKQGKIEIGTGAATLPKPAN
ncbi:MAG: VanW family protein [Clostridia bacterium]